MNRYGIAEWYGEPFTAMLPVRRKRLASIALDRDRAAPQCPFQPGNQPCNKRGGVCSLQRYDSGENGRIGQGLGSPVITCPNRFDEQGVVTHWLADVVGFDYADARIAHEVPFMRAAANEKAAGRIDMVLALDRRPAWCGMALRSKRYIFRDRACSRSFGVCLRMTRGIPRFPIRYVVQCETAHATTANQGPHASSLGNEDCGSC